MRESYLEVNLNAISYNIKNIKEKAGNGVELIPVIKANAYGLGANALKEVLEENHITMVAIAIPEEAKILRETGFKMDILLLNEQLPDKAEEIVNLNLTVGLSDLALAQSISKEAEKQNKEIKIHIEIDTGMGRVGIKPEDASTFVRKIKSLPNIIVEGMYTHFSSADSSKDYTEKQIQIFQKVIQTLEKEGITFEKIHMSASSGILGYQSKYCNMARPGIIVYGYLPDESMKNSIVLKPSTKLISKVVFLKTLPKGEAISYERTYITTKETKIATIPLGYADGVRRALSNQYYVLIHGKNAPIIGNVCMDNFMVDVTDILDIKIGDEVILWDDKTMSLEEMAKKCDTIPYEILCGISARVPRLYVKGE